jgi:signal transduction histidine kinase
MRVPGWPLDTIARRFAVTEVLAVAATLLLVLAFNTFGGVWSREPVGKTSLFAEAADIMRIIEAAPPQQRATLAAAATTKTFRVDWHAAMSPISNVLEATREAARNTSSDRLVKNSLHDDSRPFIVFSDNHRSMPAELRDDRQKSVEPRILAVQFADKSWLLFTVLTKTWGPPTAVRWTIWLLFLAVSITVVSAVAARQFAKPIERLAAAVRRFGINQQAPPIAEAGPRELRQVVQTFNAMQTQIQKFDASRTTMLAAISHDLRTPLTRIRLRGEFIDDPEQQARLFRDVDEMQAMIDGALAFFRDNAVTEETTTFDLPGVLQTIVNDYADLGIALAYTGPARAPYCGRPFALKRAFNNVIDNAIKYATPPEIELSYSGTALVVSIKDLGPGVPADSIETVFRPYFRLDKSRNRLTGGVGLGLTVAQSIVHGHGGDIILENRALHGLEVRIVLPLAAAHG